MSRLGVLLDESTSEKLSKLCSYTGMDIETFLSNCINEMYSKLRDKNE